MKTTQRSVLVAMMAYAGLALAQDQQGPEGHHRGPPPEATQACAGLTQGTACAFTVHGNNLTGTCEAPPNGSGLACRPAKPPFGEGRHHGPPKESLAACASSTANAACSFTLGDKTLTGTCAAPPDGSTSPLACRPAGMGPGGEHHRGPPAEAVSACASLSASAACTFSHHDRTVSGTCVTGRDGKALICRPADLTPPPNE